jgi:hypothetical protein
MRKREIAMLGCAALAVGTSIALLAAPAVHAVTTEEVEFTGRYAKRDRNKERGGLSLRTTIRIKDDSAPAPQQLIHTTIRFPKGAVVNARFFPKCNPANLRQRGPKGCPRGSRIGSGRAIGVAPPIVTDDVNAKVTLFNGTLQGGNPTIIIYAIPDLGPVMTLPGVLRKGGNNTPYGYILDTAIPPIQTLPSAPNASVTFFDATTRDVTVRRRGRTIHYIDSPVLCDGTFFMLDGQFIYQGGRKADVLERFTLDGGPRCP